MTLIKFISIMSSDNRQIAEVKLPGPGEILVRAGKAFVSSPKAIGSASLWFFGLWCMLYAAAPSPTTSEQRQRFNDLRLQADSIDGMDDAMDRCFQSQQEVYHAKGWFSWLSTTPEVAALQSVEMVECSKLQVLLDQQNELKRDAFAVVGLWSEFGVEEARTLFWDCLEKGKGFAKRSTFYDMLFGAVMRRDEGMGAFAARIVLNFVINMTLGLIGALLAFFYYLWGMVLLYKASFLGGLAFFAVALFAGVSMAMVYIFVVYGTVAAAGYTLVYMAVNNQRIEGGGAGRQRQQQQQQQRLRYPQQQQQQRPHYD